MGVGRGHKTQVLTRPAALKIAETHVDKQQTQLVCLNVYSTYIWTLVLWTVMETTGRDIYDVLQNLNHSAERRVIYMSCGGAPPSWSVFENVNFSFDH